MSSSTGGGTSSAPTGYGLQIKTEPVGFIRGVIGKIVHTVEDRTKGSDLTEGESIHLAGDTTTVIIQDSHQTIWPNVQQKGSHATTVGRLDSMNVRA